MFCRPSNSVVVCICAIVCSLAIFLPNAFVKSGPLDGASVPWRPAPLHYIVAWSLLCISLVVSMSTAIIGESEAIRSTKTQACRLYVVIILYMGILCACAAWSPVYHLVSKAEGVSVFLWLWMLLAPLLVTLSTAQHPYGWISLSTISPLIVWSLFQMSVNARETELDASAGNSCTLDTTHRHAS